MTIFLGFLVFCALLGIGKAWTEEKRHKEVVEAIKGQSRVAEQLERLTMKASRRGG